VQAEFCRSCGASIISDARFCPSCGVSLTAQMETPKPPRLLIRFTAALCDLLCWLLLSFGLFRVGLRWWAPVVAWILLVEVGYHFRGSIGKALFGLHVQVSGRARHYLRETLGKLASMATFGIGFLLVFSKERLALHDHIARTHVVLRRYQTAGTEALTIIGLLLCVGLIAYLGARLGLPGPSPPLPQVSSDSLDVITRQIPAVLTLHLYDAGGKLIGQGSGFILTADGLAVTNFHVLSKAYRAEAELGNGRLFHVLRIRAFDPNQDVALFQLGRQVGRNIEWPTDLPALVLGNSTDVRVGDRIATITSPEGLSSSVTDGLVSAIRSLGALRFLQVTAPISPGSSGGPIFDMRGRVIGIAAFQLREGQNLNFAIPVEYLSQLRSQLSDLTLDQFRNQIQPPRQLTLEDRCKRTFERGLRFYRIGRYSDAVNEFVEVQTLRPTEAAAYYDAALCYDQLGQTEEAAYHYTLFLTYAAENDPAHDRALAWLIAHGYRTP